MRLIRWNACLALFFACLVWTPPAFASEIPRNEAWEWDTDRIERQLPQWETPEERAAWGDREIPQNRVDPPPLAPIRNVGEQEPMTGALIRYPLGIPYALIREMAENVTIHCIVSASNYNTARNAFQANGVDPNAVDWIIAPSDSYWTRDYGPWFVFNGNGQIAIINHYYNRPYRPNDNNIPLRCGEQWSMPVHTHNLWHTGGNYMTDGCGISFSTDLVWNENAGMTHQQIFQLMQSYYGLSTYHVVPDIAIGGIHHIDTWAKLLDEETVIMKQVSPSHVDYARIEQNAVLIASLQSCTGRNYRIVRVFCQNITGGGVASYTNSIILNDKVLVPTFNNATYDAAALQVYRSAMPGYEVLGFYSSGWLTDDAIHCRIMGVADRHMLRVAHTPVVAWSRYEPIPIRAFIDDRSEAGLKPDSLHVYWRAYPTGGPAPAFTYSHLTPEGSADWYSAAIPAQPSGTTIDYFVRAVDHSGRREGMPRSQPAGWYSLQVELPAADIADRLPVEAIRSLSAYPNPFKPETTFSFELLHEGYVYLGVYDAQGRRVRSLLERSVPGGRHEIPWDGRDDAGFEAAAGAYFYKLRAAGISYSRKVVLAK